MNENEIIRNAETLKSLKEAENLAAMQLEENEAEEEAQSMKKMEERMEEADEMASSRDIFEEQAPNINAAEYTAEASQPRTPRTREERSPRANVTVRNWLGDEEQDDKEQQDWIDLTESKKVGKVMHGTIVGINPRSDAFPADAVIVMHGKYQVYIPLIKLMNDGVKRTDTDLFRMGSYRIGAQIDYIVDETFKEYGFVVGSRIRAMRAMQRHFYNGTDRYGRPLLAVGMIVPARVVAVVPGKIYVDIFGVETDIKLPELTYRHVYDARDLYKVGDKVKVKILSIDKSQPGAYKVTGSVKQTTPNPKAEAIAKYNIGSLNFGTVSAVVDNGVFVLLGEDMDCFCNFPYRGIRPSKGAQVIVKIIGKDMDTLQMWGNITHVTR